MGHRNVLSYSNDKEGSFGTRELVYKIESDIGHPTERSGSESTSAQALRAEGFSPVYTCPICGTFAAQLEPEPVAPILTILSRMFIDTKNMERAAWGYYHASGWNDALRRVMDYVGGGALSASRLAPEASEPDGKKEGEGLAQALRCARALAAVVAELDEVGPDGPGHNHSKPGIWDSDNRGKAGKPCEWCATWAEARAAVEALRPDPDSGDVGVTLRGAGENS